MATSQPTVIDIKAVSKDFILPHEKVDSIKGAFVNPFRKQESVEVQHALKDISFKVKKGEFFGIVGRNGSGKSTLLKIIAGIYKPTEGSVSVAGRLVPFIELGVGFNPELSGRENVYLNGALMGFSSKEVDDKYDAIIAFAEIERFMDQKLKNYSSGMQVRLAFSVATVLAESDVLLIDEVLAVGDADFQRKCFEYFKKLKKDKKTVIFVSHDMNAVREYCDRALLINDSEVVFQGTSDQTAKEYMRLFMPEQYQAQRDEEVKAQNQGKWGTGGANIEKITISKRNITQDDKDLTFTVKVKALQDFPDGLLYGMTIKNQQDEGLLGTNSRIIRKETKESIRAGDTIELNWSLANIFNEGTYIIEPAISNPVNMDVIQWWDDAARFTVRHEQKTPYKVAPPINLEITKR